MSFVFVHREEGTQYSLPSNWLVLPAVSSSSLLPYPTTNPDPPAIHHLLPLPNVLPISHEKGDPPIAGEVCSW